MLDKDNLRNAALHLIQTDGRRVAPRLVERFGISRQTANNHLRALQQAGLIEGVGKTQGRAYKLVTTHEATKEYPREALRDDIPWLELFSPLVATLPANVRDIWQYGMTEMVNNAVEHSEARTVRVGVKQDALSTEGWIDDNGVGIFQKIQRALGLFDPREALLELAKGKVTTAPANHTGEGIFFTSKAFDLFEIVSEGLAYGHAAGSCDFLPERRSSRPGTIVFLELDNNSRRNLRAVFNEFSGGEAYDFSKTLVPIKLAEHEGQKLVSRSQARRLTTGLNRFRQVVLDFSGVVEIGQAFADEVFRVFAQQNPKTALVATKTSRQVSQMIARAKAAQNSSAPLTAPGEP
jgi:hypothetical protein